MPCCRTVCSPGTGRPHLLSRVFGEPLNHVLQFPERDGVWTVVPGVLARVDQHGGAEDGVGCWLSWQDQEMPRQAWMDTGLGRTSRGAILNSPDASVEDQPKGWLVAGGRLQDRGRVPEGGNGCCLNTHLVNFSCARALEHKQGEDCSEWGARDDSTVTHRPLGRAGLVPGANRKLSGQHGHRVPTRQHVGQNGNRLSPWGPPRRRGARACVCTWAPGTQVCLLIAPPLRHGRANYRLASERRSGTVPRAALHHGSLSGASPGPWGQGCSQ